MTTFVLHCKYCANTQNWKFEPEQDFETMDDVLEFDYEVTCYQCGCPIRINESLDETVLRQFGFA